MSWAAFHSRTRILRPLSARRRRETNLASRIKQQLESKSWGELKRFCPLE
ncbi:hypothetical protein NXF25_012626 [Crotalus adamanteus]|uniref:Uncharacterized protein n=1 Tax=Crotalus adamanteus TaxID=8729 RepID=A0AAW1BCF4_CROAD